MSILIGITNGSGAVNASDVNANGYIDAADVALIKANLATGLP
jgi:hypothetical protein